MHLDKPLPKRYYSDDTSGGIPARDEIDDRYKWDLTHIYPDWEAWDANLKRIEELMERFKELRGTLAQGPEQILNAFRMSDDLGRLAEKVYSYAHLTYDTDQRDNSINARMQQVQILFARFSTAIAWFDPELLTIEQETMERWLTETDELAPYRFPIRELYRSREHVLDETGERLLSYYNQLKASPAQVFQALSTADMEYEKAKLSSGDEVAVSYSQYTKLLRTLRDQKDRRKAFEAHYTSFKKSLNTFASIYNAVCQRDWAGAQARNFPSTLDAKLHGNNIPPEVYHNLIDTTRTHTAPLRRYMQLRKRVLELDTYHLYDGSIPLVEFDKEYPFSSIADTIIESVAPLGDAYQNQLRKAFEGGWVDVYENAGKRSGAYSAGVYGVHPYMLLNYNDTLDNVFTVAHEMGHSMHTLLSSEAQPYATHSYTIFVAEVASTLNEALLLDLMLERSDDPRERAVLLQQAIENITGVFFSQVMFADYELRAHKLAEEGVPITADSLSEVYYGLLQEYYGDAVELDDLYRITWARIPHFYGSPYYVYQYATCYASSRVLQAQLTGPDDAERRKAAADMIELLRSGGSDHPMEQLRRAGVDLEKPDVVRAVPEALDELTTRMEEELTRLG